MKCPIFMVFPKKEHIFTEQTLLFKIVTISFNTLLPTTNKFFYAGIIKCSRPGGNKVIESLLQHPLDFWSISLAGSYRCLKKYMRGQVNMVDDLKLHTLTFCLRCHLYGDKLSVTTTPLSPIRWHTKFKI